MKIHGADEPRTRAVAQLLGIPYDEAADRSLQGRLNLIARLKAARATEIGRGKAGSWLYDVNRHLNICASLRAEYEALTEALSANAGPSLHDRSLDLSPLEQRI